MRHKLGETEGGGMGFIIMIIIAVVVLILVIIFIANPAARDYIKNLPSFGHDKNENTGGDEVIVDDTISVLESCPVKIGKIITENSGPFVGRSCISLLDIKRGYICSGLYIDDLINDHQTIYYQPSGWIKDPVGDIAFLRNDPKVGGIETTIISIDDKYMQKNVQEQYLSFPHPHIDMLKINGAYFYKDQNFGSIHLCRYTEAKETRNSWTLQGSLEEIKKHVAGSKYSDPKNKVFIDQLYNDDIFTLKEYNEITGKTKWYNPGSYFNFENDMRYVENLLLKKQAAKKK